MPSLSFLSLATQQIHAVDSFAGKIARFWVLVYTVERHTLLPAKLPLMAGALGGSISSNVPE